MIIMNALGICSLHEACPVAGMKRSTNGREMKKIPIEIFKNLRRIKLRIRLVN